MEKQNEEQVFIPAPHFAYIPFLLGDIGNNGCTNSVFAVALYGVGEGKCRQKCVQFCLRKESACVFPLIVQNSAVHKFMQRVDFLL